uniref:Synaptogyrin n=1 Tax=Periophthalmus magnuspinnatus TaxID=409849 RepID=A0A3B4AU02_9GOBI
HLCYCCVCAGRSGGEYIGVRRQGLRVFALVVLGCISNEGFVNRPDSPLDLCVFNGNAAACHFGEWAGSLAFIVSSAFIALDLYFPQIGSVRDRKRVVMADILTSGVWSLLWFVSFCFLAHQWQVSAVDSDPLGAGADAARATILFCFFSVFSWKHPVNVQNTRRKHPKNIHNTCRKPPKTHPEQTQQTSKRYPENITDIQKTFKTHPENIQKTSGKHQKNIKDESRTNQV